MENFNLQRFPQYVVDSNILYLKRFVVACEATNDFFNILSNQSRLFVGKKNIVDFMYVIFTLRDKIFNNYIK